jgi:hypothetical protein
MSDPHRDLREQLEAIAEDLGDRAMACLREAMAAEADPSPDDVVDPDGEAAGTPPPRRRTARRPAHPAADEERRLTRARRAVEKAAALLEPAPRDLEDP